MLHQKLDASENPENVSPCLRMKYGVKGSWDRDVTSEAGC